MTSWILTAVLLYFMYYFVNALFETKGNFQTVHWVMLGLLAVSVPLLIYVIRKALKEFKTRDERRQAKEEEWHRQQVSQLEAKRKYYLEHDDENNFNVRNSLHIDPQKWEDSLREEAAEEEQEPISDDVIEAEVIEQLPRQDSDPPEDTSGDPHETSGLL